MKVAKIDVFSMYCGVGTRFLLPYHLFFRKLVDHCNDGLFLVWWKELVFQVQYVAFKFGPQMYMFHWINIVIGVIGMVTKEVWAKVVEFVKA
jgi:hypothetical protein